ncbi:MAG: hypothetical protein DRJ42_06010 [Deltaproteobacteria bacterium]|nr:MAG: hypothetical protein DRJ42_06010 [Deltaproteobacteria bacterium]
MLLEPLRVRPGARFTCHGDGLCCTDVHALGPLDEAAVLTLTVIDENVVTEYEGESFLSHADDGGCVFLGEDGCAIHATLGGESKPAACQQFPFALVATPVGGRVATRHYCPCRTMGEREPLEAAAALAVSPPGAADRTIRNMLPFTGDEAIDLAKWERLEAGLLERLAAGERPEDVLDAPPYSAPNKGSWEALCRAMLEETGPSRFEAAGCAFALTVLRALGEEAAPIPVPMPWVDAFDRAEARSDEGSADAMLADWVADVLWSLEWAFFGTFEQARRDLATRVDVARRIAAELPGRADRTMAEAIAVVELVGMGENYQTFIGDLGDLGDLGDVADLSD